MSIRHAGLLCAITFSLAACGGGTKMVKNAKPPPIQHPLAVANDQRLAASVDWVIVRDGPGTWAKNADWDEYLISVANSSAEPLRITNVAVFDSLGNRHEPNWDRKQLVKGSKTTEHRYRGAGVKVRAGTGSGTLMAAGAAAGVVGVGAATAGMTGAALGGGAAGVGGAAAAASVLFLAAPALAIFGAVRAVNNSKVDNEIERRHTGMPVAVPGGQTVLLDIFFPLAPSPTRVQIDYADSQGLHQLDIDTSVAMTGLHLEQARR